MASVRAGGGGARPLPLTQPPVLTDCRELKERLKPELLELIRQQRLNRLCQGTMFRKISSRRRQGQQRARTWTIEGGDPG